jgi:ABC-type lipoprotein release transport system permease subunit
MNWIEKQRNILDLALSSLLRRWKKNAALVLVYTVITGILASVMFFTYSIKREAALVLKDGPEIVVQRLRAGRQEPIPAAYMNSIRKIAGVRGVTGRCWAYYYEPSVGANYTVIATAGSEKRKGLIAIGAGVARTMRSGVGDLVPFKAYDGSYQSFEVTKVFSSESELISSDLIEMPESDFRDLFGIPDGLYTDLTLRVRNPREVLTVADKIRRNLPDTRPVLRDEILRTYDAIFDWRGGLMVAILGGALLAFAIFAWDKATSLSTDERREIGVLKAVGWETSDVIALKSWEGIVVSLTSFLLGLTFAYLHVFVGSHFLFEPVLKGWGVLYPHYRLVPFVDPYLVASLFFLTVVPYTAATIVPTWSAAVVDPDSVMRL